MEKDHHCSVQIVADLNNAQVESQEMGEGTKVHPTHMLEPH